MKIYDSVWGYMKYNDLQKAFIDTYEFQRLRFIAQLGVAQFVFPSASHNRFEHSLGVSHIAGEMCKSLKNKHPNLVSDRDIELISIAGLVHDLGHCAFSHAFDKFLESNESELRHHENRSVEIFKYMVKKYKLPLLPSEINLVVNCILGKGCTWKSDIISSSVDADRIDYLMRDSHNCGLLQELDFSLIDVHEILYHMRIDKGRLSIPPIYEAKVLRARSKLHKTVYKHKTVLKIEHLLIQIFNLECFQTYLPNFKFLSLVDGFLLNLLHKSDTSPQTRSLINSILIRTPPTNSK